MDNTQTIFLTDCAQLDPVKTFECGQCFRWNADENGVYTGVAYGQAARVKISDGGVYIYSEEANADLWRFYFDLDVDYESVRRSFCAGEYFERCSEFGRGIRILRQEPWEALCSFIISQCNNIPRIKKIVETLCISFGEPFEFDGEVFYSFPSAERLAPLETEDLSGLRCGYRAAYIISAARDVCSGRVDLARLSNLEFDNAIAELKTMQGVGAKVANCAVLYGLHHMSGFPIDTWMKRALREHFPPDFDPAVFGEYAGLAQQYIFHYARSGGEK